MARQILSPIDLRTAEQRQGITSTQRNIRAITGILQSLGKAEQVRRERQQLDRVTRAIGEGATTSEAIIAAMEPPTEFGGGFPGILQKIGGVFQPSPGGIKQGVQQAILGSQLQQTLAPKVPEVSPTAQTQAEKDLNRDIKILTNKDKKGELKATPIQQSAAKRRIRANQAAGQIKPGQDYTRDIKDKPKTKVKGGAFRDEAFGKEAYEQTLQEVKNEALASGATEASVEADFNAWWDRKAKEERARGDKYFEFIPRSEFQEGTEQISPEEVQDYAAKLDPESKTQLEQIIAEGDTAKIEKALNRLREKYGTVR